MRKIGRLGLFLGGLVCLWMAANSVEPARAETLGRSQEFEKAVEPLKRALERERAALDSLKAKLKESQVEEYKLKKALMSAERRGDELQKKLAAGGAAPAIVAPTVAPPVKPPKERGGRGVSEKKYKKLEQRAAELETNLAASQTRASETIGGLQTRCEGLESENAALQQSLDELKVRQDGTVAKLKELEAAREQDQQGAEASESQLDALQKELEAQRQASQAVSAQREEVEEKSIVLAEEVQRLQTTLGGEIELKERALEDLMEERARGQDLSARIGELEVAARKVVASQERAAELATNLAMEMGKREAAEARLQEAQQVLSSLEQAVQGLNDKVDSFEVSARGMVDAGQDVPLLIRAPAPPASTEDPVEPLAQDSTVVGDLTEELTRSKKELAESEGRCRGLREELANLRKENQKLGKQLEDVFSTDRVSMEGIEEKIDAGDYSGAKRDALILFGDDPSDDRLRQVIFRLNRVLLVNE